MTALEILREIARVLGLEIPLTLTNANDMSAQRILGVLNRALAQAACAFNWTEMQRQIIFSADGLTDAYDAKTGALKLSVIAPDFGAAATPRLYEKDGAREVRYVNPDEFSLLFLDGAACARRCFSVMGGELYFLPDVKESPFKCLMRYVSKYPARAAGGEGKSAFNADDDVSLLDAELLVLGGVYKFKQEMGYDYADALADYELRLQTLQARDGFAPVLRGADPDAQTPRINVPDTGAGA